MQQDCEASTYNPDQEYLNLSKALHKEVDGVQALSNSLITQLSEGSSPDAVSGEYISKHNEHQEHLTDFQNAKDRLIQVMKELECTQEEIDQEQDKWKFQWDQASQAWDQTRSVSTSVHVLTRASDILESVLRRTVVDEDTGHIQARHGEEAITGAYSLVERFKDVIEASLHSCSSEDPLIPASKRYQDLRTYTDNLYFIPNELCSNVIWIISRICLVRCLV